MGKDDFDDGYNQTQRSTWARKANREGQRETMRHMHTMQQVTLKRGPKGRETRIAGPERPAPMMPITAKEFGED